MPSRGLSPDTKLSVHLDTICSRNRYTKDPAPVVAELIATAKDRVNLLTESVGTWIGYFEDKHIQILCSALRELPGLEPWIELGRSRRTQLDHRTPDATVNSSASWPSRTT